MHQLRKIFLQLTIKDIWLRFYEVNLWIFPIAYHRWTYSYTLHLSCRNRKSLEVSKNVKYIAVTLRASKLQVSKGGKLQDLNPGLPHESIFLCYTECWGRVSKGFSPHPGLNCGPLDYETSVITTTPRKLGFPLEKKLHIWTFLHFSWNWAWFRSFKNLAKKNLLILNLKWQKVFKPARFPA